MIVHHVVTGPADAPALVLSNSLGSSLAMWDPQADALAERFRLVRYDIRGHGASPVPPPPYSIDDVGADLVALLDHLGIERAATVRAEGTQAIAAAGVGRWLTDGFRVARPDVAEGLSEMIAATPDEGYAACCGVIEHMDLLSGLPRIAAPTLVIAGAQDPATPPEHAERIVAGIPGARLEVLDPGAHLVNVEQPEAVTRLILEHLGA